MRDAPTLTLLGPGSLVGGRFEVGMPVGAGGAGVVFRATDRETGATVALKVLRDAGTNAADRFDRECAALARLSHPAIVRHVAHGVSEEGLPYLAMEWLEGDNLGERLARAPLGVDETLALGVRLADALAAAHDAGLLHRDVKPTNVVLVGGRLDRPTLVDFGLARPEAEERGVTVSGNVVGTPAYMAPEQARGRRSSLDARVDVFGLGCLLWECLTGRRAFEGDRTIEVLAAVLSLDPPLASTLAPSVPGHLDRLLARMLAKDPAERPADGAEVRLALESLRPCPRPATGSAEAVHRAVLPGPPALVWAFLIDTNRWDRIAGAPPTTYSHDDPSLPRTGTAAIAGVDSVWAEVGEWVEGRWGWGERRFSTGTFTMLAYRFECRAAEAGGTEVELRAWATPAPGAPDAAATLMAAHFQSRLARYADVLARFLSEHAPPALDAHEPPVVTARRLLHRTSDKLLVGPRTDVRDETLAARAEALRARSRAADALVELLGEGADSHVRQMRPRVVADALGHDAEQVLRAYFDATEAGLVDLRFQLDCPTCRVASQVVSSVDALSSHGWCNECHASYDLDLAGNVEIVFHPNVAVREVRDEVWCAGSPVFRPHVFALLRLEPREERRVELSLPPGSVLARVRGRPPSAPLVAAGGLRVRVGGDGVTLEPGPEEGAMLVTNETDLQIELQLERAGATEEITTFADLLSFPDLHRHVAGTTEGELGRAYVCLAAFAVPDVLALCEEVGDGPALERMRGTHRAVVEAVERHRGAVVDARPAEWLACFRTEEDARAATHAARTQAPVTVHTATAAGPCLVARRREGVYLFGRTVQECLWALASGPPQGS